MPEKSGAVLSLTNMEDKMKENRKTHRPVAGISRAEEEEQLAEILGVAQENLMRTKGRIEELSGELYDLMETYGPKDKEALSLLHNTQSQLREYERDLLRCKKARLRPYFGRIDFKDARQPAAESYYVGRVGIGRPGEEPFVIDWRAPAASVYYESDLGPCSYVVRDEGVCEIDLRRKRTYEIAEDRLIDFYDSDVVANDELLTQYLAKNKGAVLGEIIATIQKEQNELIRRSPKTNLIVQGVAGSGKTTVAMHRISYILYNYGEEFRPEDFYIIGSNRILLNYITGVLPDLDVYGVSQMTMEELFVRLLYEQWDDGRFTVRPADLADPGASLRGSFAWYKDLEAFCAAYEDARIPQEDVWIQDRGVLLLAGEQIRRYIRENREVSMQNKIGLLNEMLLARLENELVGKYVSCPEEEKKELRRRFRQYFGKKKWKGSVTEIYREFLQAQAGRGAAVPVPEQAFDVYDLAALAYLYRRIGETDAVREASHVIIDEAQDFGMMVYGALFYCLTGCTYTIMGDVSQNICHGYGLEDWKELREMMLTGTSDSFGLLTKSYRNTIEIAGFATEILRHGSFSIYPVEPVCRHGSAVRVTECADEEQMSEEAVRTVRAWQRDGRETVAVICRDEEEAAAVSRILGGELALADGSPETAEFGRGVMVLPIAYTKGLEFDAVLLWHPSVTSYPADDAHVRLLYVAATRALHELTVLHLGDLTELIAEPVPEEKRMRSLENERPGMVRRYAVKEKTTREQERLRALYGERERRDRGSLGPKPIEVRRTAEDGTAAGEAQILRALERAQGVRAPQERGQSPTQAVPARRPGVRSSQMQERGPAQAVLAGRRDGRAVQDEGRVNSSPYRFGDLPENDSLRPRGHSRADYSVRIVKKTKTCLDLTSRAGVLRVTPLSSVIVRVQFARGGAAGRRMACGAGEQEMPAWKAREGKTRVELATEKLTVQAEKQTGALQFLDASGRLLLSEKAGEPRQVDLAVPGTWVYFDWQKKEKLLAKGILADDFLRMNQKAAYISFGGRKWRMPLLISEKGYGIGVAAGETVLCCDLPAYGPYVYADGETEVDYYFLYGGDTEGVLALYREICKIMD